MTSSAIDYAWVRFWVLVLHSIAPISITYCLWAVCVPPALRLPRCFTILASLEVAFYVLTYAYQRYYLQRPALHPAPTSKEERDTLFARCQDSTPNHEKYIEGWFFGASLANIKRDNVKQFLRWAFLNTDLEDSSYDADIDDYVSKLESSLGKKFMQGQGDVKCLRLTLDKTDVLHRSLIWYMCIFVVDSITHAYLRFHHFRFFRSSFAHSIGIMPPRPQAFIAARRSPAEGVSYWHLPHTSTTELPILFFHGIGVGLYPYMEFLKDINQGRRAEDGMIGILAIEILPVSSRITVPMLPKEELCQRYRAILDHHGYEKFVMVSHSYGSVLTTHLLKTPDLACRISSTILVDPISILLHQPDVAYNFTIRKPKRAREWLLWYFGSKDMGVAHTLARTFFWSENILWKEDLLDHRTIVFLSGKDSIINTSQVRAYLLDTSADDANQAFEKKGLSDTDLRVPHPEGSGLLNVVWYGDLDHGQIFDNQAMRNRLIRDVVAEAGKVL